MASVTAYSWPARASLLIFLWVVLLAITLLAARTVVPHVLTLPVLGWILAVFFATVLVSLYLGAVRMSVRLLTGRYPDDAPSEPARDRLVEP
jgi:hypothetical protein